MSQWTRQDAFDIGGMWFRVVPEDEAHSLKRKTPGHMVLEFWNGRRWIPVPMAVGFMMADFWFHEEEFVYPRVYGFFGGDKYMSYLWEGVHKGWRFAADHLRRDRERKTARNRCA